MLPLHSRILGSLPLIRECQIVPMSPFFLLRCLHDSGEYGMGTMANELSLGCDCLGQIHYLVSLSPIWLLDSFSIFPSSAWLLHLT